jgi:CBS domain-containing protein
MSIKISDLMARRVISAQPHQTVGHLRKLMEQNRIGAIPIVGQDNEALGIVTSTDLARRLKEETPCSRIMSEGVHSVPAYNDVSVAARIMRKHRIHHVLITEEKRVVGLISSFDLLKLIDGNRFELKAQKQPKKRKGSADPRRSFPRDNPRDVF